MSVLSVLRERLWGGTKPCVVCFGADGEDRNLSSVEIAEAMKPQNIEYDPGMVDFARRVDQLLGPSPK